MSDWHLDQDLGGVVEGMSTSPVGPLTPEECAKYGHAFKRTGYVRSSIPEQYQEHCRYCGTMRWAIPREPFEYHYDVDPRTGTRPPSD